MFPRPDAKLSICFDMPTSRGFEVATSKRSLLPVSPCSVRKVFIASSGLRPDKGRTRGLLRTWQGLSFAQARLWAEGARLLPNEAEEPGRKSGGCGWSEAYVPPSLRAVSSALEGDGGRAPVPRVGEGAASYAALPARAWLVSSV